MPRSRSKTVTRSANADAHIIRTSPAVYGALDRHRERPYAARLTLAVIQVCVAWLAPPAAEQATEISTLSLGAVSGGTLLA
jgi:hypothetical protein